MRITVITICFNNLPELIATCNSVDKQVEKPFEHVIIDGSTTGEIKKYFSEINSPTYRKAFHERDNGISDAFNKGIAKATGDFMQFLNSGDIYYDNNVLNIVNLALQNNHDAMWLHGKLLLERGGHQVHIGKPFAANKVYRGMRSTFHPTMFIHKSLFDKYGNFDTTLKIAMDYDFLVRIRNEKFVYTTETIAIFDNTGISSNNYLSSLQETKQVYEKHCGKSWKLTIWQLRLKLLHFLLKSKVGKWLYNFKKKIGLENA